MRIRQLECFIKACELGSISRAAAELHIAQPALGLQLRGLEDEFGVLLLHRSHRGVTTTREGEIVLEWARSVWTHTNEVKRRLRDMTEEGSRQITLALTPSLTNLLAGSIIQSAASMSPKLTIRLLEGLSHSIAEWVETGRADIGIACGLFETTAVDYEPILRERMFYISKAEARTGPIPLEEVLQRPLALPAEFNSIRQAIEGAALSIDMPVVGTCELASPHAGMDLARRGIAGSIGPYASMSGTSTPDLSVRLITDPVIERTLYILRPSGKQPSRPETRFLKLLRSALGDLLHTAPDPEAYVALRAFEDNDDHRTPLSRI
ncbi:hypothetical protein C1T17_02855 [Sphingobium sp. SCG-1]|uniref:LysR family transcriptional regulator n=1 Tax=Sphingobium sp. SCG-1 TaxID=2072936 RepID=UPI000CD6BA1D|nr:LysR family transcriptional regulator [Sphingobium sp. SCG-1]AUW57184.1 hypothetical protein C1T17_02855 [Sphingobium sp. SCG-1]